MLLDDKLSTLCACMMHKKHLLGKMLNSSCCRDHLVPSCVAACTVLLAYTVRALCTASCCSLCKLPAVCRLGPSIVACFVSNGSASASHWLLQHHEARAYPPPRSHSQGPYRCYSLAHWSVWLANSCVAAVHQVKTCQCGGSNHCGHIVLPLALI